MHSALVNLDKFKKYNNHKRSQHDIVCTIIFVCFFT